MRRMVALVLALMLAISLTACGKGTAPAEQYEGTAIALSDKGVTVDGKPAPAGVTAAVYTANDIVFLYCDNQIMSGKYFIQRFCI